MVRSFSRNTKIQNNSDVPMTLEAIWNPGPTLHSSVTIPAGEHKFVCYRNFDNEGNRYRFLDRHFKAENASVNVLISDIREHSKIVLDYDRSDGGAITFESFKGSVIRRIGYFPFFSYFFLFFGIPNF